MNRPFQAEIYYPNRRQMKAWPKSVQCFVASAALLGAKFLIEEAQIAMPPKLSLVCNFLCVGLFLAGAAVRFFEYLPLNGTLHGWLQLTNSGVRIDDMLYLYSEISHFEFKATDFYGESEKSNYGGPYRQGVKNFVRFNDASGTPVTTHIQLHWETHWDEFVYAILDLLASGALAFDKKLLLMIPEGFGHYGPYRKWLVQMAKSGMISEQTALLKMEYDDDREAGRLRETYFS